MRQYSLRELFCPHVSRAEGQSNGLEVFDLFCGGGGFSCGAMAAGCRVVFACDSDIEAIKIHQLNHPSAMHRCAALPRGDLPFPTDGRPFHVHASPPCQQFSTCSTVARVHGDRDKAEGLVEWALRTALDSGATSWSIEQVPSQHVIGIVKRIRREYPGRVAYSTFDFARLGVPQTRKRLLVAPPRVIAHMLRLASIPARRSVRDVIPILRGTHIRNSKYWTTRRLRLPGEVSDPMERVRKATASHPVSKYIYNKAEWSDNCFSLDGPSPTILAAQSPSWVTKRDEESADCSHAHFTQRECALLQTFPSDYAIPKDVTVARRLVGNAVPPLVATLLMGGVLGK